MMEIGRALIAFAVALAFLGVSYLIEQDAERDRQFQLQLLDRGCRKVFTNGNSHVECGEKK